MNKITARTLSYIAFALLGGALIFCASMGYIEDFWSGFGFGLIAIAVLRVIQLIRYRKDKDYAQKMTVERNDERNKSLGEKSRSYAFYFGILAEGLGVIVLRIFGLAEYSVLLAYVVCAQLVIYWLSYLYLRKKF